MSILEQEPWRGLSPALAEVIEPELAALRDEILAVIAEEVPEYARPLEGSFGRGIRLGVEEALRQFARLVANPDGGRGQSREVYVGLGRGEMREGRSLDSLQAAYRVGARVSWRRIVDAPSISYSSAISTSSAGARFLSSFKCMVVFRYSGGSRRVCMGLEKANPAAQNGGLVGAAEIGRGPREVNSQSAAQLTAGP